MNTTKNDVSQSTQVAERKSVHAPSASSLALLRSQVATDDHSCEELDSKETIKPKCERGSQNSTVRNFFSTLALPLQISLNFAWTRPWLTSVLITSLILVFIMTITPRRKQNFDGMESFDLGVVTRYPEQSDRQLSQVRGEEKDAVIPAMNEQDANPAPKSNTNIAVIGKEVVTERKKQPQSSPTLSNNTFAERKVASNAQNGAWLTGNIEPIELKSIRRTVRQQKNPKKHRIVLLPRIRK